MAARSRTIPSDIAPQLATLVDEPPPGDGWIHEPKLDGYRILARIERGRATLWSRNGNDWTSRMPSLARELEALGIDGAVLDGEVCALDPGGRSDFQLLQNALGTGRESELVDYVFDALFLDGEDLRPLPLAQRKARLRAALGPTARKPNARVRYTEHVVGRGAEFFAEACKLGLEGMIAKRADRPYRGGRSPEWVKVKCTGRQELVIGGYTAPGGSRSHLGALLVGVPGKGGPRLRREGRDRLQRAIARRAGGGAGADAEGEPAVRRSASRRRRPRRDVGRAPARRRDRVHRDDPGRAPPAPGVPRPAERQAGR